MVCYRQNVELFFLCYRLFFQRYKHLFRLASTEHGDTSIASFSWLLVLYQATNSSEMWITCDGKTSREFIIKRGNKCIDSLIKTRSSFGQTEQTLTSSFKRSFLRGFWQAAANQLWARSVTHSTMRKVIDQFWCCRPVESSCQLYLLFALSKRSFWVFVELHFEAQWNFRKWIVSFLIQDKG